MTTAIYLPWHDLALRHREHVTVAPRPMRLRFDSWNLARDGHAPPVYAADPSLRWLADFVRDGWEISIGKPLREMIERGAALLMAVPARTNMPPILGGALPSLPGLTFRTDGGGTPSSPFYVLTSYSTAGAKTPYDIPDNYRYFQLGGVGGGAGAGRGDPVTNAGRGGGGAGAGTKTGLLRPSGNGTFTFDIGAAGAGAASNNTAGTNGGDTTIVGMPLGSTTLTAAGGTGGSFGNGAGGAGGTATNFDVNNTGGAGGTVSAHTAGSGGGGAAGMTSGSTGGAGGDSSTAGNAGAGTSGGGGAAGLQNQNGGAGGGGVRQPGGRTFNNADTILSGGISGPDAALVPPSAAGANPSNNTGAAGGAGGGAGGGGNTGSSGGSGGAGAGFILIAA